MAADERRKRRRSKDDPPRVRPVKREPSPPTVAPIGKPAAKSEPPTVAPIAKPGTPPTVAPIAKPGTPPTVAPIAKPGTPPTVAPVARPAQTAPPTVKPVRAAATPPPPPAPSVKALDGAPGGGVMERQARASDRVASYSGMPVSWLVLFAVLIPAAISAVVAWKMTATAVAGVDASINDWGASAARLVAATDPTWWRPNHGTSQGLREAVLDRVADAEDEARTLPEGPQREETLAGITAAKEKVVGLILADRQPRDDLLASLNRERLANTLDDSILGVEFYGGNTMSAMGIGTPMPPLGDFLKHGDALYKTVLLPGDVRARMFLHPVRGSEIGSDGQMERIGYAGVLLSLGPMADLEGEANRKALIAGGIVLGLGLLAALIAALPLFPLRRVLRDAEEFSRGDFDHRPSPVGGGEVGALARSVARMALAARDRETEALKKAEEAKTPPPDHRRVVGDGLAPGPLLRVAGWESEGTSRPCFEVAGDFFDYAATEDGKFFVILSETSLWGLSAAFIAAEIRGLFRGLAPTAMSARELLENIGANVGNSLPKEASASAVVVHADPETGRCDIARAGTGNPPVAWRFKDKSLEKIEVSGPKIGRDSGPGNGDIPGEVTVELAARDRLTLFSNGLYRARNKRKEKFGEERLDGLILKFGPMNSTAFVNMVVNDVDLFHEGAPQRDDLTMVTLRRLK